MYTPGLEVAIVALLVAITAYALYLRSSLLRQAEKTSTMRSRKPMQVAPARPGGISSAAVPRRKVVATSSLPRIDPDIEIIPYVVIHLQRLQSLTFVQWSPTSSGSILILNQ